MQSVPEHHSHSFSNPDPSVLLNSPERLQQTCTLTVTPEQMPTGPSWAGTGGDPTAKPPIDPGLRNLGLVMFTDTRPSLPSTQSTADHKHLHLLLNATLISSPTTGQYKTL